MFGGYAEMLAYANKEEAGMQHSQIVIEDADDPVVKNALRQSWAGTLFWDSDRNPFVDEDNDFIVIAECNELHGPMPLFTIPSEVEEVDVNSLVISLLSVDYQHVGPSVGFPKRDVQLLIPNIREGVHVLANYSVLLDAKARGFVRPICIAYVSANKSKLLSHGLTIFSRLGDASQAFRVYNTKFFLRGVKQLLHDLQFTKDSFEGKESNSPEETSRTKSIMESLVRYESALEEMLLHVEEFSASIIGSHSDTIRTKCRKLMERLKQLRQECAVQPQMEKIITQCFQPRTTESPKEIVLPHLRHGPLLTLPEICTKGFLLGVYELYTLHKSYHKRSELLTSTDVSLFLYGACAKNSDVKCPLDLAENERDWQPCEWSLTACDADFFRVFEPPPSLNDMVVSKNGADYRKLGGGKPEVRRREVERRINRGGRDDTDSSDLSGKEFSGGGFNHVSPKISKSFWRFRTFTSFAMGSSKMEPISLPPSCIQHGLTLDRLWSVVENRYSVQKEDDVLSVMQRIRGVDSLFFALWSSYPVILHGLPDRDLLECVTRFLVMFVPRKQQDNICFDSGRESVPEAVIPGVAVTSVIAAPDDSNSDAIHYSPIRKKCLCVNLGKGTIETSTLYSGQLLSGFTERMTQLGAGESLAGLLISTLTDIEFVVQTFRLLQWTSSKLDLKAFCRQRNYSTSDTAILKHFESICRLPVTARKNGFGAINQR